MGCLSQHHRHRYRCCVWRCQSLSSQTLARSNIGIIAIQIAMADVWTLQCLNVPLATCSNMGVFKHGSVQTLATDVRTCIADVLVWLYAPQKIFGKWLYFQTKCCNLFIVKVGYMKLIFWVKTINFWSKIWFQIK